MPSKKYMRFKTIPDSAWLLIGVYDEELWYDREYKFWLYVRRLSYRMDVKIIKEGKEAKKIMNILIQKANGDFHDWTEC